MSIAPLITTLERETILDGTFPFYYDEVAVLYKRPDPALTLWKTYLHPFSWTVHKCLGVALLGGILVYSLLDLLACGGRPGCSGSSLRTFVSRFARGVNKHWPTLWGSLVTQSQSTAPTSLQTRIFFAFWCTFVVMVSAIYNGNLTAFLTITKDEKPFKTLADLANQDVYRWGVTGSTVIEYLFQVSERPDFKKLGQGIEGFKQDDPNINSLDPMVHLDMVKAGQYAYISDRVPMEIWLSEDCELRLLPEKVIPLPFVVGLHNNSAYLTLFNKHILDIDQRGLYEKWKSRWWPQSGMCGKDDKKGGQAVTIQQCQSAFYILCAGLALALAMLLLEAFWKRALTFSGAFSTLSWRRKFVKYQPSARNNM